jgi:hypothetical protein
MATQPVMKTSAQLAAAVAFSSSAHLVDLIKSNSGHLDRGHRCLVTWACWPFWQLLHQLVTSADKLDHK